ncbi:MAG: lipocalin-like domain-containing protein [Burkholderiales bacterium]
MHRRRAFWQVPLAASALSLLEPLRPALAAPGYARVTPGTRLRFPQDEGSHPAFRTEWWYVTGSLETAAGGHAPLGFQLTFFRTRPNTSSDNPSAFAPRQLLIGHVALADPAHGRLLHVERIAREGFGLATAREGRTEVVLDRWSLRAEGEHLIARAATPELAFDLVLTRTQPPLLNGAGGYSRKGPDPRAASYYYSLPQLAVSGSVSARSERTAVTGTAWLDHEWSSDYVAAGAVGWDWCGINLDDGGALMAFRMRGADGHSVWAGATRRTPGGQDRTYEAAAVSFEPLRRWRSPRTGVEYPVGWRLRVGDERYDLEPLLDDSELDARRSTGTIYWEGPVRVSRDNRPAGRGYLELTGYWKPLSL